MLLPKGGVSWKSAQARLPPTRAVYNYVFRTEVPPHGGNSNSGHPFLEEFDQFRCRHAKVGVKVFSQVLLGLS